MKRTIKYLFYFLILVILAGTGAVGWIYFQVRQSLPLLNGEIGIVGLTAPVTIERDGDGVPTVKGQNRLDVARAIGFIHTQERFFQMDLSRRAAAGELAELFGPPAIEADKTRRLHRFRSRAQRIAENLPDDQRDLLTAYAEGVNGGIGALKQKPFEYLVLRENPVPWKPEDSILVVFAMFFDLTSRQESLEAARGLLRETLPKDLAEFLNPPGTEWDAPLEGPVYGTPPVPGPEIFNFHEHRVDKDADEDVPREPKPEYVTSISEDSEACIAGSNNWAVSGGRSMHGYPILANDMHLGIRVPNTWFRARFQWPEGNETVHDITGVTLPGVPLIVVGSNGFIAWGLTNSCGDWMDLILVETHADNPGLYRTPDGYRSFEKTVEMIAVKGEDPQSYEITSTIWGPLTTPDPQGNPRAIRWTAHMEWGVDMQMHDLEKARNLDEAMRIANRSGIPPQNFVCVDINGNIGWTIIGKIPRRTGFSGKIPTSWADGSRHWDGFLEPEEYQRIVNPDAGAVWTANARIVSGEMATKIGDGGYDLGARQKQIRDALLKLEKAEEKDMLAIELDDRALFLERWRGLILDLLDDEAITAHPDRASFRNFIENGWTGSSSVDSVGYPLVRRYRNITFMNVYGWLTAKCLEVDQDFRFDILDKTEGPLWRLVTERPIHLLNPAYGSWKETLLQYVDQTIKSFKEEEGSEPGSVTWGQQNTTQIRHPLSQALPFLSQWLDMPSRQLPGDSFMPRVQGPTFGASERLAVSPGREAYGYFHMPCGQSGHPLSPYYRAGHNAWEEGRPTPFLPGKTVYELTLVPPDV
jgi:penicillin amidase